MDPLTHIMVGLGLASYSGTPLSFGSPLYTAVTLGSLIPDLDFVWGIKGEISYLSEHRGASHSVLGIAALSFLSAALISLFFQDTPYGSLFLWTLAGSVSHILLDFLNPHGIQLLWPFKRKRYHWSLLNGFDPFLVAGSILIIINAHGQIIAPTLGLSFYAVYIIFRWAMSVSAYQYLWKRFDRSQAKKTVIMPSLFSLWRWDFFIDNGNTITAGDIRPFRKDFHIATTLKKSTDSIITKALQYKVGKMFYDFTPYMHILPVKRENNEIILEFIDLRYRIKDSFLHSAVAVFNENEELETAFFCPFSKKKQIPLPGY